jgi:hypothetical protein
MSDTPQRLAHPASALARSAMVIDPRPPKFSRGRDLEPPQQICMCLWSLQWTRRGTVLGGIEFDHLHQAFGFGIELLIALA